MYEFLHANPLFTTVLLEDLVSPPADGGQSSPLPCTLITFTSYLCSHASSTSSPRSIGYANLSLNTLLSLVENGVVMKFMTQTSITAIRLCRQVGPINLETATLLIECDSEITYTSSATGYASTYLLDIGLLRVMAAPQPP